jgi:uncharacterized protein (DUF305 family)
MPSMSMGSNATGSAGSSDAHNAADVAFATDMIPHHGQAIEMATMALTRSTNPEVRALATSIKGAQQPEILKMSGWLRQWKEPVPSASMGAMQGMHVKGMMTEADMTKLNKASGAEFDKMWLSMMTDHHRGAIDMANSELAAGADSSAKALAKAIVKGQSAEVATMTRLLSSM